MLKDVESEIKKNKKLQERYFVNQDLKHVLIDFEEYMLNSRQGGTKSSLIEKTTKYEEARVPVVQTFMDQIA